VAEYEFTNSWFQETVNVWNRWVPQLKPKRILEIGSYEGQSSCYLIEKCSEWNDLEIHCVDTWAGGVDNQAFGHEMSEVENRFLKNIDLAQKKAQKKVDFHRYKTLSYKALAQLICEEKTGYFDLIYIDGSHQAPDVITDATMAFPLLRVGGMIVFDDYIWFMEEKGNQDLINMPKLAIDSFTNIFQRKIRILSFPLRQIYLVKTAM